MSQSSIRDKERSVLLYMERAERSLRLIELKSPPVIVAHEMRLVREAASMLEEMAGEEWVKAISHAHGDLLAHKESLQGGEEDV